MYFKYSKVVFLNHFSLTEPIPFGSSESDLVLTGDDRTGERLSAPTGVFVGDGSSGIFSDVTVIGSFFPLKKGLVDGAAFFCGYINKYLMCWRFSEGN